MGDTLILLLVLALFVAWLLAEWRGKRWFRMSLGVLCMLVLSIGIYVTIQSAGMQSAMHRMGLRQIDRLLQEGDSARVRRAIQHYEKTLEQTGSPKAATDAMLSALGEDEERNSDPTKR